MGGEIPTARIQSPIGLEPDARNDADHAFAKMSTGIPHLPWRDEDARAVPLGAFGLQVTSLLALGGYGVEWVASPGVSDLPPLVPKAPLQESAWTSTNLRLMGSTCHRWDFVRFTLRLDRVWSRVDMGSFLSWTASCHDSESSGCFRPVWCVVCRGRTGMGKGLPLTAERTLCRSFSGILLERSQASTY